VRFVRQGAASGAPGGFAFRLFKKAEHSHPPDLGGYFSPADPPGALHSLSRDVPFRGYGRNEQGVPLASRVTLHVRGERRENDAGGLFNSLRLFPLQPSGDLAGQFHDHGLLDEVIVTIAPVTLGAGKPLLPRAIVSLPFTLTEAQVYGPFVRLRYTVSRTPAR
jgi:hypothetical protein